MNIFNVSRYKKIPLIQAAQTILYVFSLIGGYLFFNLVHKYFSTNLVFSFLFYIIFSWYLFYIICWSLKLDKRDLILFPFIGIVVISQVYVVLSLYPILPYLIPLVITFCLYLYSGILISIYKRSPIMRNFIEYLIVGGLVIGLILLTSNWGIAGNVLGL